jgi:hypothetical protein
VGEVYSDHYSDIPSFKPVASINNRAGPTAYEPTKAVPGGGGSAKGKVRREESVARVGRVDTGQRCVLFLAVVHGRKGVAGEPGPDHQESVAEQPALQNRLGLRRPHAVCRPHGLLQLQPLPLLHPPAEQGGEGAGTFAQLGPPPNWRAGGPRASSPRPSTPRGSAARSAQ